MTVPRGPVQLRRQLAAELRRIRKSKGKSRDAVAAAMGWSLSKISRCELGRGLKPREVERLVDYYEITGSRRARLLELAEDASPKRLWEEFADSLSAGYQQFEAVPGLLQTEADARRVVSSYSQVEPITAAMIERRVLLRIRRQLEQTQDPAPQLQIDFDEWVSKRRIGHDSVMYEQLQRLVHEAGQPNISLQVLPPDARRGVFAESFMMFRSGPDNDAMLGDVISSEHSGTPSPSRASARSTCTGAPLRCSYRRRERICLPRLPCTGKSYRRL